MHQVEGMRRPRGTSMKARRRLERAREEYRANLDELRDLIVKLNDLDTQQQAFQRLLSRLQRLDEVLVLDLHALIIRNEHPPRSSTKRLLVLLLAALCKSHPKVALKQLPRSLSYMSKRLKDSSSKVASACEIIASSIALYVLPLACDGHDANAIDESVDKRSEQAFDRVAVRLLQDATSIEGESAMKCLCALIYPLDLEGQKSTLPVDTMTSHTRYVRPFLQSMLARYAFKVDGSVHGTLFTQALLIFQAACELTSYASTMCDQNDIYDIVSKHVPAIYECLEVAFLKAGRSEWVQRRRAIELLEILLRVFAVSNERDEDKTSHFFQINADRLRKLLLTARHDSISVVRTVAKSATAVFEKLNKRWTRGTHPASDEEYNDFHALSQSWSRAPSPTRSTSVRPPIEDNFPEDDGEGDMALPATISTGTVGEHQPVSLRLSKSGPRTDTVERVPLKKLIRSQGMKHNKPWNNTVLHQPLQKDGDASIQLASKAGGISQIDQDEAFNWTREDAITEAILCGEMDLAIRLTLLADDMQLLARTLSSLSSSLTTPELSTASINALCAAFVTLIADDGDDDMPDEQVALHWLSSFAERAEIMSGLDMRIQTSLAKKLQELAFRPTKMGLLAGDILERCQWYDTF